MQSESIGKLVAALGAVMADVGYVRGTGQNSHHKYSYTSDEDLAAAVQPALVRHGVILAPVACQVDRAGDRCVVVQTWRVAHSSGEWMQIESAGEGVDKQDKSVAKSLTGSRKYLLRHLLCIPTGDDIEREATVATSNAASADLSPFVAGLLDRVEELQRKNVKNAGAAALKLRKNARLSDDEIRESCAKLIDWIEAQA